MSKYPWQAISKFRIIMGFISPGKRRGILDSASCLTVVEREGTVLVDILLIGEFELEEESDDDGDDAGEGMEDEGTADGTGDNGDNGVLWFGEGAAKGSATTL